MSAVCQHVRKLKQSEVSLPNPLKTTSLESKITDNTPKELTETIPQGTQNVDDEKVKLSKLIWEMVHTAVFFII